MTFTLPMYIIIVILHNTLNFIFIKKFYDEK